MDREKGTAMKVAAMLFDAMLIRRWRALRPSPPGEEEEEEEGDHEEEDHGEEDSEEDPDSAPIGYPYGPYSPVAPDETGEENVVFELNTHRRCLAVPTHRRKGRRRVRRRQ